MRRPSLGTMTSAFDTHDVTNQPPPLSGHDVFGTDVALREALERHGERWAIEELVELGEMAGDPEWQDRGRVANENPPILRTHDRYGQRLDVVEYHPAYHQLMAASVGHGLAGATWGDERPGSHAARAAKVITW